MDLKIEKIILVLIKGFSFLALVREVWRKEQSERLEVQKELTEIITTFAGGIECSPLEERLISADSQQGNGDLNLTNVRNWIW